MFDINIAFGVTEDWIKHTFVTMCSILSNADEKDNYNFYIMSDISDENFENKFSLINNILQNIHSFNYKYIKMNNRDFEGVVHDKRVGISAYYRLKLSSIVKIDKILYLDSDIVVMNNISQLWNYDINEYLFAAVEDKYSELMCCHANLPEDSTYFNSGVLLMNLKKFRENNIENKIFKLLKEQDNNYSDQDVLNDICRKNILSLPLKYNLMLTRDDPNAFPNRKTEYKNAILSPVILHYAIKPWILPVQYSEYWRKYHNLIKTNQLL